MRCAPASHSSAFYTLITEKTFENKRRLSEIASGIVPKRILISLDYKKLENFEGQETQLLNLVHEFLSLPDNVQPENIHITNNEEILYNFTPKKNPDNTLGKKEVGFQKGLVNQKMITHIFSESEKTTLEEWIKNKIDPKIGEAIIKASVPCQFEEALKAKMLGKRIKSHAQALALKHTLPQ